MKTPDSKKLDKKDKDGKANAAKAPVLLPGFSMARLDRKADGSYSAEVKCINGDPRRQATLTLKGELMYYNSREAIPTPSDVAVYLPDGANIDVNFIFPWAPNQDNPLRHGGGVIKGTLNEGSQRANGNNSPLQAPIVLTEWINGTTWRISEFLAAPAGVKYFEGDTIFGLAVMDAATGRMTIAPFAVKEGDCLAVIA